MKKSSWIIYILECTDGTLYTGITTDLNRRVNEHDSGVGAKYTKGRGPVKVIYTESCDDRSAASKRELKIKQLSRAAKLKLVAAPVN
jgi:putative endonuclease